ncbi:hypothetical protein BL127_00027565 [Raoultella planticola]|nr:hypothetical protein BL127_00027565 [Raoultella planticola]
MQNQIRREDQLTFNHFLLMRLCRSIVTIVMYIGMLKQDLCNPHLLVVILVVLTESGFRFSLFFSQLMAKAIPVRGAIFKKPA